MISKIIEKLISKGDIYLYRESLDEKVVAASNKKIFAVLVALAIGFSAFLILILSNNPVHPMDSPITSTGGEQ